MLTAVKVGVAPSTTTIRLGQEGFTCLSGPLCLDGQPAAVSEDVYRGYDIKLREKELLIRRRESFWQSVAAIASAGLTSIAVIAAVIAWKRTGTPKVSR